MSKARILIVEDDQQLNQQISNLLIQADYRVQQCYDGELGLVEASTGEYQLILLDLMLPSRNGLSLLSILRTSCQTPVMIVSAKGAEQERIEGLREGADDYLAKPFNSTELLLRIEALLRRSQPESTVHVNARLNFDGLDINRRQQSVCAHGQGLELTPIQFNLLWVLALNVGKVLSKPYLYQTVLRRNYGPHDRSLDMHMSRVRRKLQQANWSGERLQTVHGKGYCLT